MSEKECFHYRIIASESKEYPAGFEFLSKDKIHDARTGKVKLSDKKGKSFTLKFLPLCKGHT
jgi:hypothetical protein